MPKPEASGGEGLRGVLFSVTSTHGRECHTPLPFPGGVFEPQHSPCACAHTTAGGADLSPLLFSLEEGQIWGGGTTQRFQQ